MTRKRNGFHSVDQQFQHLQRGGNGRAPVSSKSSTLGCWRAAASTTSTKVRSDSSLFCGVIGRAPWRSSHGIDRIDATNSAIGQSAGHTA